MSIEVDHEVTHYKVEQFWYKVSPNLGGERLFCLLVGRVLCSHYCFSVVDSKGQSTVHSLCSGGPPDPAWNQKPVALAYSGKQRQVCVCICLCVCVCVRTHIHLPHYLSTTIIPHRTCLMVFGWVRERGLGRRSDSVCVCVCDWVHGGCGEINNWILSLTEDCVWFHLAFRIVQVGGRYRVIWSRSLLKRL